MLLEQQVCSLGLAKRLKELGVKQDSYFWWQDNEIWDSESSANYDGEIYYSAFTVAELGELLPDCIYAQTASDCDRPLFMNKIDAIYSIGILNENKSISPRFINENEANARAAMLTYLIENDLLKV